jgi:hypothetical protein
MKSQKKKKKSIQREGSRPFWLRARVKKEGRMDRKKKERRKREKKRERREDEGRGKKKEKKRREKRNRLKGRRGNGREKKKKIPAALNLFNHLFFKVSFPLKI